MELKTLHDINIRQFNDIIAIELDQEQPRYERELLILQLLFPELTEDELVDLPLEFVDRQISSIITASSGPVLPSITVDGQEFHLKGDLENFQVSFGQFRAFAAAVQKKADYLPDFMARVYVNDTTTPEERSALFVDHLPFAYVVEPMMALNAEINKRSGK